MAKPPKIEEHSHEPPEQTGVIVTPADSSAGFDLLTHENLKHTKLTDLMNDPPVAIEVNQFNDKSARAFEAGVALALKSNQDYLVVTIDSYGGDVYACLRMIDTIRHAQAKGMKVVTLAKAKAMSAGSLLFSVGDYRYATKDVQIMIHHVGSWAFGKTTDLMNDASHVQALDTRLQAILDEACGQASGYWAKRLHTNNHSDLYLTAKEAVECGLATDIGTPQVQVDVSVTYDLLDGDGK